MDHPRTVLFDFDGTLADTLRVGLDAWNVVAPGFGMQTIGEEETEALRSLSSPEMLRHFGVPLHKLPLLVQGVRREMNRRMPTVSLFDGIRECLLQLRSANVELGVVTSNSRANVTACLKHNHAHELFEFVRTSTHLFGKDRALRRLLRARRLAAVQAVYVGDQDRDVEAARKCGIPVIAACWGYQSRDKLASHSPDLLAETPTDVTRFVLRG